MTEVLTLRIIGQILLAILVLALWIIPDPIGLVVKIWKFFREG